MTDLIEVKNWGDGQTKKMTCPLKYLSKGLKSP